MTGVKFAKPHSRTDTPTCCTIKATEGMARITHDVVISAKQLQMELSFLSVMNAALQLIGPTVMQV